jgi:predicted Zn-dependent peptidase
LQIVGESSASARSAAVGFFVRTGSRDETPEVCGVSHFLEHMVFKGTERRSAFDVNRDFDSIGADYNAFTSEENTVYHAAVLPEYLPRVTDILADILRPSLREDDFQMEKKVIINEIGRYEDMPMFAAYDNAKKVYFAGHALGNSILGTPESITALGRDAMHDYFRRRYVANNVLVSVAGAFDWPAVVELVEKHCGAWESGPVGRECLRETGGSQKQQVMKRDKVAQQYLVLMSPGPSATSPLRHAADLLSMVVGDDSGSRLYWALIDPGLAESADFSFHEYDHAGVFYTSCSGEPEQTEENLQTIREVLGSVQKDGISEDELNQARNKLLSRVVRSGERPKGRMMAVGTHWTYQGEYRSVDDELRAYEGVTLADVRQVLDRYPLLQLTTLALGPLGEI